MTSSPQSRLNGSPPAPAADLPFEVGFVHRVRFTRNAFDAANATLASVILTDSDRPARVVVLIDRSVADAWPRLPHDIAAYVAHHRDRMHLAAPPQVVTGGEAAKNDWSVFHEVSRLIHDARICRHSYVLAIGGGAMLDAVGFAAATAHRGVRLIRFPTTTLAQDDAGVGVKNGINAFGKKNFTGAFATPWAVINDAAFLATLSDRDWRSGLSEAVKVALIKDAAFFSRIEAAAPALKSRNESAAAPVIQRSAELHLAHIVQGGDPFELNRGRPLDFGHWAAHKLESLTNFRLRHGEAVAIGLAIDVTYSGLIGLLAPPTVQRVLQCLVALGFDLNDEALGEPAHLLAGLEDFREHLGGTLAITLLRDVADPLDVHEIDHARMAEAVSLVHRGLHVAAQR